MKSYKLRVWGIVQGVGFRPFIYRLAKSLNLRGWILNSTGSVQILIQGEEKDLEKFMELLLKEAPPLSRIEGIEKEEIEVEEISDFKILESKEDIGFNFISPDIAICEDCLREMRDPKDRRYNYPFINCTNCGPRYTIIEDLPYDRDKTTMKIFEMCEECYKEYHDPSSRRFHAQPISCYNCGPQIWIYGEESKDLFKRISEYLDEGKILAIKGIGGFHLACDATQDDTVRKLRERKKRPSKPFALMMKDIETIKEYCFVSEEEEKILKSKQSPIVLLRIKDLKDISPLVAPGNNYLGVMLPYAPYHHLIFDHFKKPLIMTSGNLSDEPIVKDNEEAMERLKNIADIFVFHNREIKHRIDDSVVFVENKEVQIIRRARGYAPDPVKIPIKLKPTLALGGELKNTFSLGKENYVFMSPHIGDLKDKETLEVYEETIQEYIRLFKIEPEILVHDLHPQYLSTDLAQRFKKYMEVRAIQHHKAHFYSLLLDREITEDIICFTFDGTGYGEDGKVWGGEVFVGNIEEIKRVAHFKYFPIVGGDIAIENPRKIALSYILKNFPEDTDKILPNIDELEKNVTKILLEREENVFYTSSCGRIFDLVSALLGIRERIDYEGQAAIELEMHAMESKEESYYPFRLVENEILEIDILPSIEKIIKEKNKKDKRDIARKFHNTVSQIIIALSEIFREEYKINKIGFSGGVFQNRLLLETTIPILKERKFEVYTHQKVPTNDGGISLGQMIMGYK
ncbi:carbamoyltransferase HypF [Dictyoglomus thermophilum]|uniref:Carbamoyltransferase n=1 Tax=Dictyoglomus thermophilum (strain ATCC 35947 / DSM 3960 / H-6-12) TaxID=309799 RepID=B5YB71_DICT6|nr:carbamoyltransferase HypF [Dictyoglomus thermophilum]ACI18719.1 [NiFe] hydrogenase maturation protein HypF [Dictyoglomus thermophilum H-6-12]